MLNSYQAYLQLSLKRCPGCKTVVPDDSATCDLCGISLANVLPESSSEIDRDQMRDLLKEQQIENTELRKIDKRRVMTQLSEFLTGIVFSIVGFILVGQYQSLIGVVLLLLGLMLAGHSIGMRFYGGRRSRGAPF